MKVDWKLLLINDLIVVSILVVVGVLLVVIFIRPLTKWIVGRLIKRIMSESYKSNIWEMITASTRSGTIVIMENSLRANSGKMIKRPFGSPRKFLNFEGLVFSPAQLYRLPASGNELVEMKTIIGPNAKKPLIIDTPLLAAAMGYAIAVSGKVKRAIAKATAAVGTATNSGQGAFLPEERALAKHLILQYAPGHWSKSPEILRQADAIEIHIGQGALAASTKIIPPKDLQGEIRETFTLSPDEDLIIPSHFKEMAEPEGLKRMVHQLREETGGVPIGVKICASGELEEDLEIAILAEVDFISIDGAQAGSEGGAPIFEDDFGLPTMYALSRAVQYMNKRGVKDKVSLLIGGGFHTPGECLKALALGADAVYMGTALLWAMTHDQIAKTMPWEPPTHLVFYSGKMKDQFDEKEAAFCLEKFINSCTEEMKEAVRALGKHSIQEVNSGEDLLALDEWTSNITQVRLAYGK